MDKDEVQEQVTWRDEVFALLQDAGLQPLARTMDHGNQGVLVALPSGRLVSIYCALPVNTFLER